jgi:hypothetical protein
MATVLMYLSDVEKGGETIFPRIGLEVPPKKVLQLKSFLSLSLFLSGSHGFVV